MNRKLNLITFIWFSKTFITYSTRYDLICRSKKKTLIGLLWTLLKCVWDLLKHISQRPVSQKCPRHVNSHIESTLRCITSTNYSCYANNKIILKAWLLTLAPIKVQIRIHIFGLFSVISRLMNQLEWTLNKFVNNRTNIQFAMYGTWLKRLNDFYTNLKYQAKLFSMKLSNDSTSKKITLICSIFFRHLKQYNYLLHKINLRTTNVSSSWSKDWN